MELFFEVSLLLLLVRLDYLVDLSPNCLALCNIDGRCACIERLVVASALGRILLLLAYDGVIFQRKLFHPGPIGGTTLGSLRGTQRPFHIH